MTRHGKTYAPKYRPETVQQRVKNIKNEQPRVISLLVNSPYYFIENVCIIVEPEGYRLFVYHKNLLLLNRVYKTDTDAMSAFIKHFEKKAWREGTRAEWTPFYSPDEDFDLLKKIRKLAKHHV